MDIGGQRGGAAGMAQSISSGLASIAAACSISEGDKVELPGEDGASEVATVVSVAALPENVLAWARG